MGKRSSLDIEAINNTFIINYRDRFLISMDNETTLSLSNYETSKNISDSTEYNIMTSFKKRHGMKKYTIRPLSEFSLWTSNDRITSATDKRTGYGTGFEFDIPPYKK